MLKVDIEKMKYEISGSWMDNLTEFSYLTVVLIELYGEKAVKRTFKIGCNKNFQEDIRNGQI